MRPICLIRNIRTGYHKGNTRLFLEPTVLEAAGFQVGEGVRHIIQERTFIITRAEDTKKIISKRKRPSWAHERPLYDACSKEITLVFREREYVDLLVSDGMIVIRPMRSFDLFVIEKPMLQGNDLKKLRLYSAPCGGGMATAALCDTGFYEAVGALDVWSVAVDAYLRNFGSGYVYLGDLKTKHPDYIPSADVCWLSPNCTRFSSLGGQDGGITEGHGPHYARIVLATGAEVVMIEQVPQYFQSRSYQHLKMLLSPFFPFSYETIINAHDLGSVASRKRGYAVFFREEHPFQWPELPKTLEHRRKTVGQVIGREWESGNWKPITGTVMEGLLNKSGNNNFKAEKNHTLVSLEGKLVSAFTLNYQKTQVTSSYLKHPESDRWRLFRSDEMMRLMSLPDSYEFPEFMGEGDRIKLIGQSVDGGVVKAIGIEVAAAIMNKRLRDIVGLKQNQTSIREVDGQYTFQF
ncbi:DNA cytosine methyltransferase [Paenibacillus alvei]|uniref:DNA cytosine methyltransferase n=1 Tax=Paenibacillus alvei TaxID=44250 RepID=UPI0002886F07|nr:DNA cytosine methyltransferase [Paenibacillus alvei]EJW13826.1 site-specific DNA methylase [Paenibacillus alvei DSM 29]MCY9540551.1 DNA cytosine methyltransferase [Paenibacillus alvei]MCY9708244.1 DNA cytosine methyltransferase [Paenibacillus alvei]MCY9732959.1 DNA cytosine methyltransferase [Paenibacillus alvei]MCY9755164.1 DNA cytosine methyltransferase [Paenibacillus alvei]